MAKELTDSGYLLSPEEYTNHFKVYAGPGAGKTHFLANNVNNIVETSKMITTSDKRCVLCITYTNAAANELKARINRNLSRVVVSTIHGFINEYIIKPYQPLLKKLIKDTYSISIPDEITMHTQIEGRGLLFGHHRQEVYDFVKEQCGIVDDISYSRSAIESVAISLPSFELKGSSKIDKAHILSIKEYLWSVIGVLSHDETLWAGLQMALNYPIILYSLRVKFPFIFVDEYQDTSPLQTQLIQLICSKGAVAGVIGDSAQSIYSFQGAYPRDFVNFAIPLDTSRPVNEFVLKTNRRSKDNIVKMINYIRQKDKSLADQKTETFTPNDLGKVVFYVEQADIKQQTNLPERIKTYIDNGAYVLTRTWAQTFQYIQGIDAAQSKVINDINNLYTYQLNRDFRKTVSEFRDVPWVKALVLVASLEKAYLHKNIPAACQALKDIINAKDIYRNPAMLPVFVTHWKQLVESLDDTSSVVDVFRRINTLFETEKAVWKANCLIEEGELLPENPSDTDEKIYSLLSALQYKTGRTLVNEVFSDDSKYMTVHQAKGREFEKVLVYLAPARSDGKVSYLDMLTSPDTTADNEYDRIMYVAMSRAISELGIHVKTLSDFSVVTRSIDEWCKQHKIARDIYSVEYE